MEGTGGFIDIPKDTPASAFFSPGKTRSPPLSAIYLNSGLPILQPPPIVRESDVAYMQCAIELDKLGDKSGDYRWVAEIDEGVYGVVYKALHLPSRKPVAIKKISMGDPGGVDEMTVRECLIYHLVHHHCVVQLLDIFRTGRLIHLVMEILEETLDTTIKETRLDVPTVRSFTKQLAQGLAHLKSLGVLHRDFRPANILVSGRKDVKIADFSMARHTRSRPRSYTNDVTALWWRAPEALLGSSEYDHALDAWGLGLVCAEMLTGKPWFVGDTRPRLISAQCCKLGPISPKQWPEVTALPRWKQVYSDYPEGNARAILSDFDEPVVDFVLKILRFHPADRLSADAALLHEFLTSTVDNPNGLHGAKRIAGFGEPEVKKIRAVESPGGQSVQAHKLYCKESLRKE